MKLLRYVFLFVVFIGIHFLEGFGSIGSLSIAQLWKMPILLLLLIGSFNSISKWTQIEKRGYLMILALFLCPAVLTNPTSVIIYAAKELPFFLFLRYWFNVGEKKQNILWLVLITISQYVCLSSLLTLTGLVKPMKSIGSFYYGEDSINYYSSVFGAPHAAGSYFCMAIITLLVGYKNGMFKTVHSKLYNMFLLVIAWYSLYLTFVRTAWLMTVLAVITIFVEFKKLSLKHIVIAIVVLSIVTFGVEYLYNHNDAFNARITGKSKKTIDTEGSGRLYFWKTGIDNWSKNGLYGLLFGKGYDKVLEDNLHSNGIAVFSHNQFVDALSQYGLVGLILLVLYYIAIYKFIRKFRQRSQHYKMCLAMFISTMVFAFFQNEIYFIYAVMFSLALAILYFDGRNTDMALNSN